MTYFVPRRQKQELYLKRTSYHGAGFSSNAEYLGLFKRARATHTLLTNDPNSALRTDLKSFTKSLMRTAGRSAIKRPSIPADVATDSLVFESRFESGNLLQGIADFSTSLSFTHCKKLVYTVFRRCFYPVFMSVL